MCNFAGVFAENMKYQKMTSYRHILKYTSLFGSVQVLIILIGLVRNKVMAVLLGVVGVGFNSLMMSMQTFASQATNLGISFGAVPRLSEYYEQGHQRKLMYYILVIRLWSVIAAGLGLLFCLAVSPFVNSWSFTWGNHTLHYAMLGLSVAMLALTGGETAILKATRQLGKLVRLQIISAIVSVILSIPLYFIWGQSGVVPAIVLIAFATMIATMTYSYRCYPLRLRFKKSLFYQGAGMIRLGLAFVLAAAIGSASEMLIRSFLNVEGGLNSVGLYNVGYMLTITYAGMVFASMENDYFPRLSAVSKDISATNEMVNKQIEVSLLLLAPMLVGLLMFLPVLVPLLFSDQFVPVVTMAQVAVLAMYFKVLTMPVSYVTLARSYPMSFLFLETIYFVALIVAIVVGYTSWGIWGTGVAIVAAHACEYLTTTVYAYWKYDYRCTWKIGRYAFLQMLIAGTAYAVSVLFDGWAYWMAEAALTIVSTACSLYILHQKTHLWEALMRRFKKLA